MTVILQLLVRLDQAVFAGLNWIAGRNALVDWLARVGADDHIVPVALALLVLSVIVRSRGRKGRETAFNCLLCVLLAVIISTVVLFALNSAFFRPRPFTSGDVRLIFYHNTDSAFPSNAATLAFAMAFATVLHCRGTGAAMLAAGLYLGLARVVVGVHYPLDIAGGVLLGLSGALLARAAGPLYMPLARGLGAASDRLLASWKADRPITARGGERR